MSGNLNHPKEFSMAESHRTPLPRPASVPYQDRAALRSSGDRSSRGVYGRLSPPPGALMRRSDAGPVPKMIPRPIPSRDFSDFVGFASAADPNRRPAASSSRPSSYVKVKCPLSLSRRPRMYADIDIDVRRAQQAPKARRDGAVSRRCSTSSARRTLRHRSGRSQCRCV